MSRKARKLRPNLDVQITEYQPSVERKSIKPKTQAQADYLKSIQNNIITFAIGMAGTGKSMIALSYACDQLESKQISKILITRPIVEAGEEIGFLKGDLGEKTLPYMQPMLDIMNRRLGKSAVEYHIKRGNIEFRPLAYLRGTTFESEGGVVVIADEFQNTTPKQMQMFLTRIGENCKVIIDGDLVQCDIQGDSGLKDAISTIGNLSSVGVVRFGINDIVRSGIVRDILIAYGEKK